MAFLLRMPADPEMGEPWWLTHSWHGHLEELAIAYPALHYPRFVFLFLAAVAEAHRHPARASWKMDRVPRRSPTRPVGR